MGVILNFLLNIQSITLQKVVAMLYLKSVIIGVLSGVALVFILGAADRKGKKRPPPAEMFQLYDIPNNDSKAVILNTANGKYKIANLDLSPNFESGDRFMGPPPE